MADKSPLLGDDLLISAIKRIPSLLNAAYAFLSFGAFSSCSLSWEIGTFRFSTSSITPSIIEVRTFESLISWIDPF